jgi:hypothetical protein
MQHQTIKASGLINLTNKCDIQELHSLIKMLEFKQTSLVSFYNNAVERIKELELRTEPERMDISLYKNVVERIEFLEAKLKETQNQIKNTTDPLELGTIVTDPLELGKSSLIVTDPLELGTIVTDPLELGKSSLIVTDPLELGTSSFVVTDLAANQKTPTRLIAPSNESQHFVDQPKISPFKPPQQNQIIQVDNQVSERTLFRVKPNREPRIVQKKSELRKEKKVNWKDMKLKVFKSVYEKVQIVGFQKQVGKGDSREMYVVVNGISYGQTSYGRYEKRLKEKGIVPSFESRDLDKSLNIL